MGYQALLKVGGALAPPATPLNEWNPLDKAANVTLSNLNRTATTAAAGDKGCRGVVGKSSGKWYFEAIMSGTLNSLIGLSTSSMANTGVSLGGDTNGIGWYYFNGKVYHNNIVQSIAVSYAAGQVLQVAVDFGATSVWFGLDNTFTGSPSAGTGASFTALPAGTYYPTFNGSGASRICDLYSIGANMAFSPPSGFSAWQ